VNSALGQAGFRIGVFVALTSGLLLLILDRNSAEYVLMVATFSCSALFLLMLVLLVRYSSRR
jgi:hypothetical protein